MLDADLCYRAIASRDRRFDGRFVTAVRTTRVYRRPGCPAPLPKRVNCAFYPCAAAAEAAGFRPCRRCRPDASPGTPLWSGTSATVSRALRLIQDGARDGSDVDAFAERLGVGARQLRRLFERHLGASPHAIARTRRVHFARRLLDDTSLPVSRVAEEAGFASVRTFNDAFLATFHRSPRKIRRLRAKDSGTPLTLRLPYRPPYDSRAVLAFLRTRAIPGVESVSADTYRRSFELDGASGALEVTDAPDERCLHVTVFAGETGNLATLVSRVGALFDVGADPLEIGRHLRRDPLLRPLVAAFGRRVDGGSRGSVTCFPRRSGWPGRTCPDSASRPRASGR